MIEFEISKEEAERLRKYSGEVHLYNTIESYVKLFLTGEHILDWVACCPDKKVLRTIIKTARHRVEDLEDFGRGYNDCLG